MEQEDGPEGKGVRQREDVQSQAEALVVSQMKMAVIFSSLVEFTKSKLDNSLFYRQCFTMPFTR